MSEASAVQNPMLRYAAQIGWDYISRPEAMQQLKVMLKNFTSPTYSKPNCFDFSDRLFDCLC